MIDYARPGTFKQVVESLRLRKLPTLEGMIEHLAVYRKRAQAAVILSELDLREFQRVASGKSKLVVGDFCEDPMVEACLGVINNLAPLDLEAMSMRFEDGSNIDELYPACYGYPLGWDEWEEIGEHLVDRDVEDELALYLFVTSQRMGEGNVLFKASEHFSWDLEIEDVETLADPNWVRLFELLDQHDLGIFKNAINVCLYDTGNPYFDYNPWDEGQIYSLPEFSLEGVQDLVQAWEEARPILADLQAAVEQFSNDPSLARVLMMLYNEAQDEKPQQPQTLAEIWAGEGEEQGERILDPFYGPIGLTTIEDEEEENE